MSVNYWKNEAQRQKKASKFAWGQYFQLRNELFDNQLGIYENLENPKDIITEHLQKFISELYEKSKTYIECSICMEVIITDNLETTPCGHNFHKDCLNTLKQTKEVNKKTVSCPKCKKDLWCKV